ncbi:unnamed protein product [Pseudo-nitzschia multistriata]|uniref:Uncharacterized protein n=1 Tax=Pseudo-nitzschia multistriata TaxID=183589 RepID=A0A448ZMH5_9STRA|nr:unnamed protein product [Pseudo-nitzschia multistriata]
MNATLEGRGDVDAGRRQVTSQQPQEDPLLQTEPQAQTEEFPSEQDIQEALNELAASIGVGFIGDTGPQWHYPEEEIVFSSVVGSYHEEPGGVEISCGFGYAHSRPHPHRSCPKPGAEPGFAPTSGKRTTQGPHADPQTDPLCSGRSATGRDKRLVPFGSRHANSIAHPNAKANVMSESYTSSCAYGTASDDSKSSSLGGGKRRLRLRKRSSRFKPSEDRENYHHQSSSSSSRFARFREAARCLPFEYASSLATMCVRPPYGVDAPSIFSLLDPHTTDEDYCGRALISSPQTIQVAIAVHADNSRMLLFGNAGLRYQKQRGDRHWTDVEDVGALDVPLGYVRGQRQTSGSSSNEYEYSLDEVFEQAMLVREQYCSALLGAALEESDQNHSLLSTPPNLQRTASPPSLAISTVSASKGTPGSEYYYDGSNRTGNGGSIHNNLYGNDYYDLNDDEGSPARKRLDFMQCLSPSVTSPSDGTGTGADGGVCPAPRPTGRELKLRKRRRRKAYRFCQKVLIVFCFYCTGIFLVVNLTGVGHERLAMIASILRDQIPDQSNDNGNGNSGVLVESLRSFLDAVASMEDPPQTQPQDTNARQGALQRLGIVGLFSTGGSLERMERECSLSLEAATNTTLSYQREALALQASLEEASDRFAALSTEHEAELDRGLALRSEHEEAAALLGAALRRSERAEAELDKERSLRIGLGQRAGVLQEKVAALEAARTEEEDRIGNTAAATEELRSRLDALSAELARERSLRKSAEERARAGPPPREIAEERCSLQGTPSEPDRALEPKDRSPETGSPVAPDRTPEPKASATLVESPSQPRPADSGLGGSNSIGNSTVAAAQSPVDDGSSKNHSELHSIQNVLLKSALSDKGPLLPKVYRKITKGFRFGIVDAMHAFTDIHPNPNSNAETNAKTIPKEALSVVTGEEAGSIHRSAIGIGGIAIEGLASPMHAGQFSQTLRAHWKEEASQALDHLVRSVPVARIADRTREIGATLRASTGAVLRQGRKRSGVVRSRVAKNVEEAAEAGSTKLDHGQVAMRELRGFVGERLGAAGRKVGAFCAERWEARGQPPGGLRRWLGSANHYYKGFVGRGSGAEGTKENAA